MKKTLIALTFSLFSAVTYAEDKPNILFIFADDYAYDCVHSHGNSRIETPNLDKLTKSGTHFTHAYNSGAWGGAVCVASRTMMMTGKQLWNARETPLGKLVEQNKFLPQRMRKAGYETYFSGKWHVGSPTLCQKSWVHTTHIRPGMPNQTPQRYKRKMVEGQPDTWSPFDKKKNGFWKGGKHWSEVLADDGVKFLSNAAKQDKPFMMMLCFNAPHDPRQAPESYQKKYPYKSIGVPKSFQKLYPYDIGSNKIRDEQLAPFPRTPYSVQVNRSEYYALITHMDTQVGRILDALEKTGKAKNTIIIFTADHGLACGHHGLLGKQNMYEHSVRVPWVISGPNIPAGKKVSSPIYLQDAMATCLDIAGADKADVQFESVLPLLKGDDRKKLMYSSYMHVQRMVISDGYKLIVYPVVKKMRLYHLDKDPGELKDLSADPANKQKIADLKKKLLAEMKRMNDPLDLENPVKDMYKKADAKKVPAK